MPISKIKNSPYWQTRFQIGRVRVQESTGETTREGAKRYEDKRRQEVREQLVYGVKPKKTWLEAQMRWLTEMQHKRSLKTDIAHFKWLDPYLNHLQLEDITKELIEEIAIKKEQSEASPATVNRILALIKSVLNKCLNEWDWINKVPYVRRRIEDNSRIRWLSYEESERLLSNLPQHLKQAAKFSLATGVRMNVLCNLQWRWYLQDQKIIVVPKEYNKNKKVLTVHLNDIALKILHEQIGSHSVYIFSYRGRQVKNCNTKAWTKALIKSGITDFRWHDLRHTWATWHALSGTTVEVLQKLGNWLTITMPLRYVHLSQSYLQKESNNMLNYTSTQRTHENETA